MKKLRRLAIAADGPANTCLETTYWPQQNARFAQTPAAPADFHRRCPSATALDRVFRLEAPRTVAQDWVVRYHNRLFQLERQSGHAPARSTVRGSRPVARLVLLDESDVTYRSSRVSPRLTPFKAKR